MHTVTMVKLDELITEEAFENDVAPDDGVLSCFEASYKWNANDVAGAALHNRIL